MDFGANKVIGIVKWFNDSKGYGFITDGKDDYFVHFKSINGTGRKTLVDGQRVSFAVTESAKGFTATDVDIIRD